MQLKVKAIIKIDYHFMALILALVTFSSSLYAEESVLGKSQFSEPQFSETLSKAFTIIPNYIPNKKCIYIKNDDTIFYISKPLLEKLQLTQPKKPASSTSTINGPLHPEKIAEIKYAKFAKVILGNQLNSKDQFGCTKIKPSLSTKTLYLIKRLLNSGQVAVLDRSKNKFTKKITVKYSAKQNTLGRIAYMTTTIPSKSVLLLRWKDYL
jgi:hypothetical protein